MELVGIGVIQTYYSAISMPFISLYMCCTCSSSNQGSHSWGRVPHYRHIVIDQLSTIIGDYHEQEAIPDYYVVLMVPLWRDIR